MTTKALAVLALLAFAPVALADPDLRPVFVVEPRHVADATKPDREVHAMAKRLDDKRSGAAGIGILSALIGGGMSAAGYLAQPEGEPPNMTLVITGAAVSVLGFFVALARTPEAREYREVEEAWNLRHPDQPITVRD
jgi:hypothetical protein